MNAEARQRLQKAVQAKVDRVSKNPRPHNAVPFDELEVGAWYVGDCWCSHVAMWDGEFFQTLRLGGIRVEVETIGYSTLNPTGFKPYKRIPNPR